MADDWQKKYRWVRTWPDDTGRDGKPVEDYSAYDGDRYAGRIRLEQSNLKKGMWHWAGAYPRPMHGSPIMPNVGYKPSAAEAAKTVEDYWDAMKALAETRKDPGSQ